MTTPSKESLDQAQKLVGQLAEVIQRAEGFKKELESEREVSAQHCADAVKLAKELEALKTELAVEKNRSKVRGDSLMSATSELAALREKYDQLDNVVDDRERKIEELEKENERLQFNLAESELFAAKLLDEHKILREQEQSSRAEIEGLKNQAAGLAEALEAANAYIGTATSSNNELANKYLKQIREALGAYRDGQKEKGEI